MLSPFTAPSSIKLLAVGWTAIRALDSCPAFPAEQRYIALTNDAVVLRTSNAHHKLFLWQDPASGEYRNTIVDEQPAASVPSDGLVQLVRPGDSVFLIAGFGQDAEAAQLLDLAAQAQLAGGKARVIGTAPEGPGYTKEQQTALSQINLLKQHLLPPVVVPFGRNMLLRQSSPDTEIMTLYRIVDRMLIKTVQRVTGKQLCRQG